MPSVYVTKMERKCLLTRCVIVNFSQASAAYTIFFTSHTIAECGNFPGSRSRFDTNANDEKVREVEAVLCHFLGTSRTEFEARDAFWAL